MTQNEFYKLFAFIVALKRSRNNSVILKKAYHKLSREYSLSPQTFKKYLYQAIDFGIITELDNRYEVKQFAVIVKELHSGSGLYFGKHDILSGESLNVKEILNELYECYVIDNIYNKQSKKIKKKSNELNTLKFIKSETGKRHPYLTKKEYEKLKQICKKSINERASIENEIEKTLLNHVITSCRHVAKVLGISKSRSNKVLSNLKKLKREIALKWIEGCNEFNFEMAKIKYPRATVYPLPSVDKIKVCFGSILTV